MQSRGFVDLQVNGFAGVDFNAVRIEPRGFRKALAAMLRHGRDAVSSHSHHGLGTMSLRAALRRSTARSRKARSPTRMVPGYHLEGPFLNPADGYAGCHPPAVMIAPDADLVFRLEAGLVETDPPCHDRSGTPRQRSLHSRHERGRQDRGDRAFGGRCRNGCDGRQRRRPHVDASGQRPAADPAETRQHAVRPVGGARTFSPVSSSTASICRNRPCAR